MSLSPSFSSAIDTVSFSFIIGTAPRDSSTSSAEKALWYLRRSEKSARVSSICAAT